MKTWRERIVEARERGYFTQADTEAAGRWHTCAIGEQREKDIGVTILPVSWMGAPEEQLAELGCEFGEAVTPVTKDFDHVEAILDEIEARVLQLKREAHP